MSALPKPSTYTYPTSTPSKRYSSRQKRLRNTTRQSQANVLSPSPATFSVNQATVEREDQTTSPQPAKFPQVPPLPVKLRVLLLVQKSSLSFAFVLIATSIAVYVSTMRIPELWSKKYQDLETLQRQERQLVATNESLKHKLAQQEDNELGLITSNNTLFIPPASLSQTQQTSLKQKHQQVSPKNIPMGY